MRRFVAILILFLLPLQWSHAAMGEHYPQDYSLAAPNHDGQHAHQQVAHHPIDNTPEEKGSGASDQDCHQHQTAAAIHELSSTMVPRACTTPITFVSHSIPSRAPDNPFRPPLNARL